MPYELSPEEYDKYQQMNDQQKFDYLISQGYIEPGSQFVPGLTDTRANEIIQQSQEGIRLGIVNPDDIAQVKPSEWGFFTPQQVQDQQQAQATRQQELITYMEENRRAQETSQQEANIAKNEAIDVRLVDVKQDRGAVSQLDPTKRLQPVTSVEGKLAPNFFSYEQEYLSKRINSLPKLTDAEKAEIIKFMQPGKIQSSTPSTFELSEKQKAYIKAYTELQEKAYATYVAKYGKDAYAGSIAANVGSFIFTPARALAPDVTVKDISGMEWAIGGAQVALLAAPGIGSGVARAISPLAGKVVTAAIVGGSGVVMSYDTAKNWTKMTPAERGIAVTMDTLVVVSAVLPIAKVIRTGGKVDVIKASQATIKYNQKAYSTVDKALGKNYGTLAKDQIAYAQNIKAQYQLKKMAESATNQVEKIKFQQRLKALSRQETVLNKKLVDSGRTFTNRFEQIYTKNIQGEPTIAENIRRLPNDLPKQTKAIIMESLTNGKAEVNGLKAEVVKLETELKALREKYPTSPEKWGDVSADLQYSKARLNVAMSGSVEQMQMNLQATRDNITYLRKIVNSQADDVIRAEARTLLKQAMDDEKALAANLKQAYNAMDAEWSSQQMSRGGVKTVTRPPTKTPMTGFGTGTTTQASTNTMTAVQLAAIRGHQPADAVSTQRVLAPVTRTKRVVSPATDPTTKTMPGTKTLPGQKPSEVTKPTTETQQNTRTQVKVSPAAKNETRTDTSTGQKNETQIQPGTLPAQQLRTSIKTKTLTGTQLPPTFKTPYLRPNLQQGKSEAVQTVPKGSVTWKQGIVWITRLPPYRQEDTLYTKKKPKGAVVTGSARTAFDTIQTISGKSPGSIPKFDMGIVDVLVTRAPQTPSHSNRAAMRFKVDPRAANRPSQPHASGQSVRNQKVGKYYVAGPMVSRKPIGKRKHHSKGYPSISQI